MKARIHIYEIFQKFKYFLNNILSVSREIIFSKDNEYDFLTSINFFFRVSIKIRLI